MIHKNGSLGAQNSSKLLLIIKNRLKESIEEEFWADCTTVDKKHCIIGEVGSVSAINKNWGICEY